MYIGLINLNPFRNLSASDHRAIQSGWANDQDITELANERLLPTPLIQAYYSIKDIEYYDKHGLWPGEY